MDRKAWIWSKAEQLMQLAAILIPAWAALGRVAVESSWSDDMATVRGLGLVAVGAPAPISTVVMQAVSLLPVGPLTWRAAIASALALGACSAMLQSLARRLLDAHVPGSFLNAPLAAIAALTATLGPALQREATVGAGSTFVMSTAVGVLLLLSARSLLPPVRWALAASLLALLALDSPVAAAATCAAAVAMLAAQRELPRRNMLVPASIAFVATAAVAALPALIRPAATHAWLNLGRSLTTQGLVTIDTLARPTTALGAWRDEVGSISVALAAIGVVVGLLRKRTRPLIAPCALLIIADIAFPATSGAVLATDPLMPVRMLAVGSVAIIAALGVQIAATTLIDMGLPMARAVAVLLLMFQLTLVAVASEQSAFTVDRSGFHGAVVYADEALLKLEPRSMALVRSQAIAWRMLSARVVGGSRPDVLVVPVTMLHRGSMAATLMAAEPSVATLLRDVAMDGAPGELAVSQLADKRVLYVEVDPKWNVRVATHLLADGLWLRLNAQPSGASDRKLAIAAAQRPFEKLVSSVRVGDTIDRATAAVLLSSVRQQAVAAAMVGDKKATASLLDRIATFDANDLFVRDMKQRLEHSKSNVIDVTNLLR